jgi:hypothetical protein
MHSSTIIYFNLLIQMFGREAAKQLDYVECFPDGYRTGTKMIDACIDAKIEGFPTWIINGQVKNVLCRKFNL